MKRFCFVWYFNYSQQSTAKKLTSKLISNKTSVYSTLKDGEENQLVVFGSQTYRWKNTQSWKNILEKNPDLGIFLQVPEKRTDFGIIFCLYCDFFVLFNIQNFSKSLYVRPMAFISTTLNQI